MRVAVILTLFFLKFFESLGLETAILLFFRLLKLINQVWIFFIFYELNVKVRVFELGSSSSATKYIFLSLSIGLFLKADLRFYVSDFFSPPFRKSAYSFRSRLGWWSKGLYWNACVAFLRYRNQSVLVVGGPAGTKRPSFSAFDIRRPSY